MGTSLLPKRFANVKAIGEGRKYVVIGYLCWGAGPTLEVALENCRKASGREFHRGRSPCLLYDAPVSTYVTDDGNLSYTATDPKPVLLGKY